MARLARRGTGAERRRFLAFLSRQFGVNAEALRSEYSTSEFADWYRGRLTELKQSRLPLLRLGTTEAFGCEALYLLVRAAKPKVVVETGVLYGASSAHILAALARNGDGTLHSIDLGTDPHEPPNDFLVPDGMKDRWRLILGDCRLQLPSVLAELGNVNLFHHDSLHTSEHMNWEYETVFPYLPEGGVLSSHDVLTTHSIREIFRDNAFVTFCVRQQVEWKTFQNYGLAIRGTRSRDTGQLLSALGAGVASR